MFVADEISLGRIGNYEGKIGREEWSDQKDGEKNEWSPREKGWRD